MKIKKACFIIVGIILLSGCTLKKEVRSEELLEVDAEYSMTIESEIEQDSCYICGDNEKSLMGYYRKSGMIGLVCLNTMSISSLDTRPYSDDGTEIIDDGNLSFTFTGHGEEECMFHIQGMPSHGILEADISYGENCEPDFDKIKECLCQKCLDHVIEMYDDAKRWDKNNRFPDTCLVDFQTNELYTLGENYAGYWIRDFWVHIDHEEERDSVMVIYAPEGKME